MDINDNEGTATAKNEVSTLRRALLGTAAIVKKQQKQASFREYTAYKQATQKGSKLQGYAIHSLRVPTCARLQTRITQLRELLIF